MIIKFLKKKIKSLLLNYGYKITKINKSHFNRYKTPSIELINILRNCKGIIHIGAHRGDEAHIYNWFGKKVIWYEANPEIFESLKENISSFKEQMTINELLLDAAREEVEFFISNNDGASSSIFTFGELSVDPKKKIWKNRKLFMKKKNFN